MSAVTVRKLIHASLRVIGAVAKSEPVSADDEATALDALNMMLLSWSAKGLMTLEYIKEDFPLSSSGVYTIGAGATFDTPVPVSVESAFVRDASENDCPIVIVQRDVYDAVAQKSQVGTPEWLFFDPGATQQASRIGTIYLWRVPDASVYKRLYIRSLKHLTEFASVGDEANLPPAYYEAVKYNLAIRVYREFHEHGKAIPDDIVGMAKVSKRTIEKMNSRTPTVPVWLPGSCRGGFDITTGE